jgi:signal transduction histidine kinase
VTRRPLSLFARLLLLTLPVEAGILFLFGLWLVPWTERRALDLLDLELKAQRSGLMDRAYFDEEGRLRSSVTVRALKPEISGCLLDEAGKVLWESPAGWFEKSGLKPTSEAGLQTFVTARLGGERWRVLDTAVRLMRPEDPGPEYATGPLIEAVVAEPLATLEQSNLEFRAKAAGVGAALLVLTGALLWRSLRLGLSPIWRLLSRLPGVPGPAGLERLDEEAVPEELRPLAREINGLLDRLWGLVELEKRFAAEAAHELRTPLTLVKSTLQTAQLTGREAQDYRGALQDALEDLDRLEKTAQTLLSLARSEALHVESAPAPTEVRLSDLLKATAHKFAPAAKARAQEIIVDCRPCEVRGDSASLDRLFASLADNAVKYSRPGGRITLRCGEEREGVVAWVEDAGPPVPKEERAHLFRPFYRGSSGRSCGATGAGLGLSIARQIARLHGADLTHEYAGDMGNRFVVRFPGGTGR